MRPVSPAEAYAVSRRTLVEATIALQTLSPAVFVLVGAHAVQLRAPENALGLPAFTFDGDFVVNPAGPIRSRAVRGTLEAAGFGLRDKQSGLYERPRAPREMRRATQIDVFVPAAFEHEWDSDAYDARATMAQPGLEACLIDRSPMEVATVDDGRPYQSAAVDVAGVVALLVAKGWKIGERYDQGPEAFAEVRKDLGDVYRLLQASTPDENANILRALRADRSIRESVSVGSRRLADLCTTGAVGLREFGALLGRSEGQRRAVASFAALVEEFTETVDRVFAEPLPSA